MRYGPKLNDKEHTTVFNTSKLIESSPGVRQILSDNQIDVTSLLSILNQLSCDATAMEINNG